MPNNYDAVAWFYDGLSQLIFGKAIVNAQRFLVQRIPEKATVLIVGGGTGWILEEIARVHASGLNITYVEISGRMINLSKERNYGQNEVGFIHAAIEDCELTDQYDVILTPFLFDNFSENHIRSVFEQLNNQLKPGGIWLLCDFQIHENQSAFWQKLVIKMMYWFFGLLCQVETKRLIDMHPYFHIKYELLEEQTFFHGFISSGIFTKRNDF